MKINYFNLLFVMTISGLAGFYLPLYIGILLASPFAGLGVDLWPILEKDDR